MTRLSFLEIPVGRSAPAAHNLSNDILHEITESPDRRSSLRCERYWRKYILMLRKEKARHAPASSFPTCLSWREVGCLEWACVFIIISSNDCIYCRIVPSCQGMGRHSHTSVECGIFEQCGCFASVRCLQCNSSVVSVFFLSKSIREDDAENVIIEHLDLAKASAENRQECHLWRSSICCDFP